MIREGVLMNYRNIAALALVTSALAGCGDAPGDKAKTPDAPPVEVSAADISKAFQENEAKAQLAYEGKPLLVSGTVKDIDLSIGDSPVIKLKGSGDAYNMGVNKDGKMTDVDVHGLTKEQAAAIDKGAKMTFLCGGISEVMGSAQLDDCAVQPAAAAPAKK